MAEVVLRGELAKAGLAGQVTVDSAGTGDWHAGGPMDARARAELARRGYDGGAHRARQIDASWLGGYDLILAMDRANLRNLRQMATGARGQHQLGDRIRLLRSFDPAAGPDAEVPDPYGGDQEDYAEVFDQVLAAARGLVGQLAEQLPAGG
jgi:protein-tyrosine phosphatase